MNLESVFVCRIMATRFFGVLLTVFFLSSFVFAGSSMSTNFVIRGSDDISEDEDKACGDYLFWVVAVLIIVYILFRFNLKRFVNSPKKKIVRKKRI